MGWDGNGTHLLIICRQPAWLPVVAERNPDCCLFCMRTSSTGGVREGCTRIHALSGALRCGRKPPGPGVVAAIPETTQAGVDRSARAWDGITSAERHVRTGVTHGSLFACHTFGSIPFQGADAKA